MKKLIFTIYFFLGIYSFGFCQQLNVNSDESVPPSDRYTSGYTYDWDKGYSAIADFVLNPNGKNKEASVLIKRKDFPHILNVSDSIPSALENQIKAWMEGHSNEIIQAFKQRNDIVTAY